MERPRTKCPRKWRALRARPPATEPKDLKDSRFCGNDKCSEARDLIIDSCFPGHPLTLRPGNLDIAQWANTVSQE